MPQAEIAAAHLGVEGLVLLVPAVAAGLAPEREDFGRRQHTGKCRAAQAAAAFFSSRSSRRRILPTLVFGRSVLNSISFGTL